MRLVYFLILRFRLQSKRRTFEEPVIIQSTRGCKCEYEALKTTITDTKAQVTTMISPRTRTSGVVHVVAVVVLCMMTSLSQPCCCYTNAFSVGRSLVMMGARRGKGSLKNKIDGNGASSPNSKTIKSLNAGKGQEITGVSLPDVNTIKGWQFGQGVQMACANVDGKFYAVQGTCPRCAFDLFKGDLIFDDPAWDELPRVACPTCSTSFSLRTGKHGPGIKRKGLEAFVGNLAKVSEAA